MPTIEIVCVEAETIPELPTFSTFGWLAETKLRSHRGLFQHVFDATTGLIVHLVTKGFEDPDHNGGLFAGELIDWNGTPAKYAHEEPESLGDTDDDAEEEWDYSFLFEPAAVPELRQLMEILLAHSPLAQLYFATDWQFGPVEIEDRSGYTISSFFAEHDRDGLRWHRLYRIENG